jgi:Glycosyl hydrolase family 65, N-terminal domain
MRVAAAFLLVAFSALGNGRLGAMVFGDQSVERLQLNEGTRGLATRLTATTPRPTNRFLKSAVCFSRARFWKLPHWPIKT